MPPGDSRCNPYSSDLPAWAIFVGRSVERERLTSSVNAGNPGVVAVMGGRGMGKTSLARRAERDGSQDVRVEFVGLPRSPRDVLDTLGQALGGTIDERMLVRSVAARFRADARPVALIIDEVEGLLGTTEGVELLESLRVVREAPSVGELLRVVVLGGSGLRDLLQRDVSPFLRAAHWLPIRSLEHSECERLMCEPLQAVVPAVLVEWLHRETGGHPLLLQRVLARAVERGWPKADQIERSANEVEREQGPLFEMFWRNLRDGGQRAYHDLLDRGPLSSGQRLRRLGNNPDATLEVLETTGVVAIDPVGDARVHGGMFERWVRSNRQLHNTDAAVKLRGPKVREVLCRLVADPRVIKMISSDAGIDVSRIDQTGSPEVIWHEVLDEASKRDLMVSLLVCVHQRYQNDDELSQILAISR